MNHPPVHLIWRWSLLFQEELSLRRQLGRWPSLRLLQFGCTVLAFPSQRPYSLSFHSLFRVSMEVFWFCQFFVWCEELTRLHRLSRLPIRWGSCTIASAADATAPNLRALARMFLAAFTSRSTMNPQERHFKVRFSSGFILDPHIEHFTEVPFGFT